MALSVFLLAIALNLVRSQQSFAEDNHFNLGRERATFSEGPTSCSDLSALGHSRNGYYLAMNPTTQNLQTVYCDFNQCKININFEKYKMYVYYFQRYCIWLKILYMVVVFCIVGKEVAGEVVPKAMSVSFSVGINASYSKINTIIPFQWELLNTGGAMNSSSGIFTAPVAGTYYFAYSGMRFWTAGQSNVALQKNGVTIASSYAPGVGSTTCLSGIQAMLELVSNDTINLMLVYGQISDIADTFGSAFTGFLVRQN